MLHDPPRPPILYSYAASDQLIQDLAQLIIKAQFEAIEKRGRFTLALSGGSLPKMLKGLIGAKGVEWNKWHVFLVDERVVPLDHPDSNYKLVKDELFSKVPIPEGQVHPIDVSLADDLEELADDYETKLIQIFAQKDTARFPVFDVILLGMGPDGHTASLFPNHELLSVEDRWIAYIDDSPKPPPKRITFTFPVINHALKAIFVATGEGKQDVLKTILDQPEVGLPASRVLPKQPGSVFWFVDDAAAAKTQYGRSQFKL